LIRRSNTRIVLQQASGQRLRNAFEHGWPLIGRSFEQLCLSQFAEIRIMPDATNPCIRASPDRVMGLAVPGSAFAADEMVRHIRHRHALGQAQDFWIAIQVPLRLAIAAVDLQQFSSTDQVADGHRLEPGRRRLAPPFKLHQLGRARDQIRDPAGFIIAQRLSERAIAP
jgi:hypothetical protein